MSAAVCTPARGEGREMRKPQNAEIKYIMWKTRDGRELRVVDMDDQHLVNSVRMLERRAEHLCETQDSGVDITDMLPSMDYDFFLPKIYDDLCFEAITRGIQI